MSFSWPWKLNPTIFQLNPNFSSARERAQTLTLKFKGFVKAFLFTLKAKPSFLIKEYFCESTKFGDVNIDMYIYIYINIMYINKFVEGNLEIKLPTYGKIGKV